ncbi:putative leader peptide [Embleya sp. NPDC127516]
MQARIRLATRRHIDLLRVSSAACRFGLPGSR